MTDGAVVCRQLGYPGILLSYDAAHFGRGSGTIWLDDVQCRGTEEKLTDCSHNGWENHNCQHSEDAGVKCSSTYTAEVRLVNGPTEQEGLLKIFYNGQWGSVCDDDWDDVDSQVVCRQLGFSGKAGYFTADTRGYTTGTGEIWLDSVTCSGDEEKLEFCNHNGWGNHDCTHIEDVGVSCSVSGGGLSGGAIAGIVIGSLVGLCCFYCCCLRKEKKKPPNVVLVSNTRIEGPLELGNITRATDEDTAQSNGTSIPENPTNLDASLPELPPPSYDDIGKYSSYGDPDIAYPSAPPSMLYPDSAQYSSSDVTPSAPPAYSDS
ncbi:scavenger receptor cysteine-rich domain-containing group B protein-like [Lytechinus pictus]|uniref:scavenger receptor cysteine-rich domain-containing group B protein-like n=1 Tax=Lytechinus pictus TaxID=7653 RepID=UPI0030B9F289